MSVGHDGDDADAQLLRRIADPGWTPPARALPRVLAHLAAASDDDAPAIIRVLLRRSDEVGPLAVAAAQTGDAAARVRVLRLVGRLITSGKPPAGAIEAGLAALRDAEPSVRRQAARVLGGLRPAPAEVVAALADRLAGEPRPDVRRAAIEALGKLGGPVASAALAAIAADVAGPGVAGEPLERARIAAARATHREAISEVALDAAPPTPREVVVHCRRGLAGLVADELAALGPVVLDGARVAIRGVSALAPLAASRLALRLGIPLPPPAGDDAAAVAAALTTPATRALLAALTHGAIRYRLAWDDGAHHRAQTFAIAAAVAARAPELINDPSDATWQVRVGRARPGTPPSLELEPRRFRDARFAHRLRDVPAASHPTIAAALARLALRHASVPAADVVWDPFVGSGQELIERAHAGPFATLHGTDLDDGALAAAAANLDAAGVRATLVRADATTHRVAGLTCIVTNPPLGRRVARGGARELLERFLDHAAASLRPDGLLVWISPFAADSRARAAALGFVLREAIVVDLGGFDGEIQVLVRAAGRPAHQQRGQELGRPDLTRSRRRPTRRR